MMIKLNTTRATEVGAEIDYRSGGVVLTASYNHTVGGHEHVLDADEGKLARISDSDIERVVYGDEA